MHRKAYEPADCLTHVLYAYGTNNHDDLDTPRQNSSYLADSKESHLSAYDADYIIDDGEHILSTTDTYRDRTATQRSLVG